MVKNNDLPRTSGTTKIIAETINALAIGERLSQAQVGKLIGRSQSYASTRLKGMEPWTTEDIEKLAKHFGFPNAFGLIDRARGIERKNQE